MATIKHISSKNADYGAAEAYLTFEHDEFTMKPVLDENGRLIPRTDYRMETLNCGNEDFALSCIRANMKYGKNNQREDIKSHHYIISFDPRDSTDNGLTADRAQELGLAYCKEHFPGHQAIVCTHPDGHNHSGNIHVHIVINSMRIAEVERKPYMDRPSDTRAGAKHRCTAAAFRYFRSEVMEMCHRAGLYQIDLLSGSKNKVTEREYWARKQGQRQLDKEIAAAAATGTAPPRQTKFETDKDSLRNAIRAKQVEFLDINYQLAVRAELSASGNVYRNDFPAERRPLYRYQRRSGQRTGGQRPRQKPAATRARPSAGKKVNLLIDIQAKMQAGKGKGFERWATVHNLKEAAKTLLFLTDNGISDYDELAARAEDAGARFDSLSARIKQLEGRMADVAQMKTHIINYSKTRDVFTAYKKSRHKKEFRTEHADELQKHEAAKAAFDALGGKAIPKVAQLTEEYTALLAEKKERYEEYKTARKEMIDFQTAKQNVDRILGIEPEQDKQKEQER